MKITTLDLKDIRVNLENIYKQELIEELADSIKEFGQLENATVYKDIREDGKKYTLIGGHRRYAAIAYLAERGEWKEGIKANIIERPKESIDEKMIIIADNHQRSKDVITREKEIIIALEAYEKLKSEGKRPKGKKRDWIAKKVGLSPRWVQEYIRNIQKESERAESGSSACSRDLDPVEKKKKIISMLKSARATMNRASNLSGDPDFVIKAKFIMTEIEVLIDTCEGQ